MAHLLIYTKTGTNLTIRNNILTGGLYGIWNHCSNIYVHNNIIKKQTEAGYRGDGDSSVIVNNTFDSCNIGIKIYKEPSFIRNNIIMNCLTIGITNWINKNSDYNCFFPATMLRSDELNSFAANPLFVDYNNGNYQLTENSPCIDAGENISWLKKDFAGNNVPSGSNIDVGAFEYMNYAAFVCSLKNNCYENITIGPNPAHDYITVYANCIINTLRIYKQNGDLVFTQSYPNQEKVQINISNYPKGIYIIQIKNHVQKLIFN